MSTGNAAALITVSVMIASIMQALDATIANVALPHIQGSLSATQDQITWVLTSYIIATAIMMPLSGWLAGQFGRKLVLPTLHPARLHRSPRCCAGLRRRCRRWSCSAPCRGWAAPPSCRCRSRCCSTSIRRSVTAARWRCGEWAWCSGPIVGPALGGWLTDDYNWRWVFYINVPFGIVSFLGVLSFLAESPRQAARASTSSAFLA